MPRHLQAYLFLLFFSARGVSATPASSDLKRARTKKPRDAFRAEDQTKMSQVLNRHLLRAESNARPCDQWSTVELQNFMASVATHRNEDLQQVYNSTSDRRQLSFQTVDEYRAHWADLNEVTVHYADVLEAQRESHCREAVMMWVHHLTEEKRTTLRQQSMRVPLLPEGPKRKCGNNEGGHVQRVCASIEQPNSCDWCHSTQADHDAGKPGTTAPDGLNFTDGPDDGNPHHWDRKRRCDQDQLPRCQLCEGIGGQSWSDNNSDIHMTPCEIVALPSEVNMSTVAPPLYPKKFTMRRKDGKSPYSDTLIGWKLSTDQSCFSFFPQNDSIGPLCYRSEMGLAKYYDISKEAARTDYTLDASKMSPGLPNTTSHIIQVGWQMWVVNKIGGSVDQCVCTNPSGQHCTKKPCYSYVWHWDTFKTAQYLGRERIGVEWIQDHGVGNSSKIMELDHFILWSHHLWTDPVSRRLVRAWKPFNGLQVYDPEGWVDDVEDESVFEAPPAVCKKPTDPKAQVWRIHCDDNGNYNGTPPPPGMTYHEHEAMLIREQMQDILKSLQVGKQEVVV